MEALRSGYNFLLYLDPSRNVINPPGAYAGYFVTGSPDGDFDFLYLDGLLPPVMPTVQFARLNHWENSGMRSDGTRIDDFDGWGLGGPFGVSSSGRWHVFQGTRIPANGPGATGTIADTQMLRFTVEFNRTLRQPNDPSPLGMMPDNNMQTFGVWIDEVAPIGGGQ